MGLYFRRFNDDELLRLVHENDPIACREVYDIYLQDVFNKVWYFIRDVQYTKDVMVSVFSDLYSYPNRFQSMEQLDDYLTKVIREKINEKLAELNRKIEITLLENL